MMLWTAAMLSAHVGVAGSRDAGSCFIRDERLAVTLGRAVYAR